jgi:hypothetical protein
MISNTALRTIETNTAQTQGFSTKQSGKMFNLLVSGLYSDKPQSITREIWSNAYDAHRDAGKADVPFKVRFPSTFSPLFLCRDYGKGLSHEFMLTRYTVLGDSTKEDTNNAVGKWGVGRMSPLSYTNSFNVTSVHQGMMAHYVVQLGADGGPELHVMAEPYATDEPSGLKVSFPVERKDVAEFASAADRVSFGFDVKPDTNDSHTWPKLEVSTDGGGYHIYKGVSKGHNIRMLHGQYAKMGCVLYPIPRDHAGELEDTNIIIDFDIGELEVTASREGLSFGKNDPTKDSIKSKLAAIMKDIHSDMQRQVSAAPTLLMALKTLHEAQFNTGYRIFSKFTRVGFKYKGQSIGPNNHLSVKEYLKHDVRLSSTVSAHRSQMKNFVCTNNSFTLFTSGGVIFLQDTSKKVVRLRTRMWDYIQAQPTGEKGWAWIEYDGTNPHSVKTMKKLVALTEGIYKPVNVEDLHDAGPVRKTSGTKTKVKVKIPTCNNNYQSNVPVELDDKQFTEGGIYIPTIRGVYQGHNDGIVFFKVLSYCTDKRICVVPKTLQKKFEEASQWVEIEDAAKAYAKKEFDKLNKYAACSLYANYVKGSHTIKKVITEVDTGDIAVSPALKILQRWAYAYIATKDDFKVDRHGVRSFLTATMGIDFKGKKEEYERVEIRVLADYPMFKFMDYSSFGPSTILEYIEDRQHRFTTTDPAQKG